MSDSPTLPDVQFISADDFQKMAAKKGESIAVVDVRDDERSFDGHIAGSAHFPSASFSSDLRDLQRLVRDKEAVVFHCALSQVRGPRCARQFLQHQAAGSGPSVFVLQRGFNGWSAQQKPVCSCNQAVCKESAS